MTKKAKKTDVAIWLSPRTLWISEIIFAAGGKLAGMTKLQKLVYLLEVARLGQGFYYNFCPYCGVHSEDLDYYLDLSCALGIVDKEEIETSWGSACSVFKTLKTALMVPSDKKTKAFVAAAAKARSFDLVLVSTAVHIFLRAWDNEEPWANAMRRHKCDTWRLLQAKNLYKNLRAILNELPDI